MDTRRRPKWLLKTRYDADLYKLIDHHDSPDTISVGYTFYVFS